MKKSLVIEVFSKEKSGLGLVSKNEFMGRVVVPVSDLANEEIQSKWFPLQQKNREPKEVQGHILLKLHFSASDKGKMHKLKDLIDIYFYDPLAEFLESLSEDLFCLFFDHRSIVPTEKEIKAIVRVILYTPGIPTTKILEYILTEEVKYNDHAETLFRRNSLASKLVTAFLHTF